MLTPSLTGSTMAPGIDSLKAALADHHQVRRELGQSLAVICFALYAVLVLALHALRTGYDPMVSFVSEYALGRFGWVMTIALTVLAGGGMGLVAALDASAVARRRSVAGILLAVWITTTLMLAIFPIDPIKDAFAEPGPPQFSTAGWVHAVAGMVSAVALMSAMALVSIRRVRTHGPGGGGWVLLVPTTIAIVGYAAMLATRPGTFPAGFYQRLYLLSSITWLLFVAIELRAHRLGADSGQ